MATQEKPAGLLSKVAKFVQKTTNWGDLDDAGPVSSSLGPDSVSAKDALKAMIERKRRNDAVRRREFDHLRKLRQASVTVKSELAESLSLFKASTGYSDMDERAQTLKKIDDIEAQMSRQWWRGRSTPADLGTSAAASRPMPQPPKRAGADAAATRSVSLPAAPETADAFASTQASDFDGSRVDDVPTQFGQAGPTDFVPSQPRSSTADFAHSSNSVFSVSKVMSVDLSGSVNDPLLEEAAIRYANGDDAGAEQALLAAVHAPQSDPESVANWAAALFDIYRCTGNQAAFERLALAYAERFGASAPVWFSVPELLGAAGASVASGAGAVGRAAAPGPGRVWRCPSMLDDTVVKALSARAPAGQQPDSQDWTGLQTVHPNALEPLTALLGRWSQQPLRLALQGVDRLEALLRAHTVTDDATVPPQWWLARLAVLRLLGLHDEFEAVALDYCITYEVSPPAWQPARCMLVDAGSADASADPLQAVQPGLAAAAPAAGAQLELKGELLGDADVGLSDLPPMDGPLRVSCHRLIRVDFSAAGSLLNWAAALEAQGVTVELRDVPRQVASFFNLIGIGEHARVVARTQ